MGRRHWQEGWVLGSQVGGMSQAPCPTEARGSLVCAQRCGKRAWHWFRPSGLAVVLSRRSRIRSSLDVIIRRAVCCWCAEHHGWDDSRSLTATFVVASAGRWCAGLPVMARGGRGTLHLDTNMDAGSKCRGEDRLPTRRRTKISPT